MGKRLAAAPFAILVALSFAASAGAGERGWKDTSGSGSISVAIQSVVQRGADTIITFAGGSGTFAGTFTGPIGVDSGVWVIHPDGSSRLKATGVVTAAIGDCGAVPGGVRYKTESFGQAQPDGSVLFHGSARTVGHQAARYRINLSTVLPAGALASTFTYSGRYRCAGHGDDD
jgi:hypothetical protein